MCKPYGMVEIYGDSSLTNAAIEGDKGDNVNGEKAGEAGYDIEFEEDKDSEDPAYEYNLDGEEIEELDSGASDVDDASDEELVRNKKNYRNVKNEMKEWDYEESDFNFDELRSISSSSEDENSKIGSVGPPMITKKKDM